MHFVLKRSFPARIPGDMVYPDLWDVLSLPGQTRVVVIYREPCAAVYSTFRRRFDTDLRRLAIMCADTVDAARGTGAGDGSPESSDHILPALVRSAGNGTGTGRQILRYSVRADPRGTP